LSGQMLWTPPAARVPIIRLHAYKKESKAYLIH